MNWIKVQDAPIDVLETSQEVVGFNPNWIDPDFNPRGTRVCFHCDYGWQSAKYCSTHDIYEHEPNIDIDVVEENSHLYTPTHILVFASPTGEGVQICDCNNCEHVDDNTKVCSRCNFKNE